jgi:enoyl-CoA hydratase/3-hydroxyacyl-CoA dehydrogenase
MGERSMSSHAPVGPEILVLGACDGWSIAELCEALKRSGLRPVEVRSPDALRGVGVSEGPVVVVSDPERLTEFEENLRELLDRQPSVLAVSLDRHLLHEVDLRSFREKAVGFRAFRGARGRTAVELVALSDEGTEVLEFAFRWLRGLGFNVLLLRGSDPGPVAARAIISCAAQAMVLVEEGARAEAVEAAAVHRLCFGLGPFSAVKAQGYNRLRSMAELAARAEGLAFDLGRVSELLRVAEGLHLPDPVPPVEGMWRVRAASMVGAVAGELAALSSIASTDRSALDAYVRDLLGSPVGPLAFADLLGLDVVTGSLELGAASLSWTETVRKTVERGELGAKSGQGFLRWPHEQVWEGKVLYELCGTYALITLSRPEKLNALDEGMWAGLRAALRRAAQDERVRAVLVRGQGKAFSAGDDIAMMASWRGLEDAKRWHDELLMPLLRELLEHRKPLIALVDGIAFGGGCELLLGFDVVVASERSLFSIPEALIGAIPPIASSIGPSLLGRKVIRYALTGEWITAEEASRLGIVDVVVPHDRLWEVGVEFVVKVMRSSPQSVRAVKEVIAAQRASLQPFLSLGTNKLVSISETGEFREGLEAFLRRRSPSWFLSGSS